MSAQAVLFGLLVGVLACGWSVHAGLLRQQLRRAHQDRLTGMDRREQFQRRAQRALRRRGGCVGLLDLDGLKQINDTHGHAAGDAVLAAVAHRLRMFLGPQVLLGRLGGDEFSFLAPISGNTDQVAARIRHAVRQPLVVHTGHGYVWLRPGVSVGTSSIAACRRRDVDAALARTLARADAAMYRSKPQSPVSSRREPRRSRPSSGPGARAAEQPALHPQ